MSRKFLIAFLAAAFLAAPSAFGPAAGPSFSGSAQAGPVIVREVDKATPMTTAKPWSGQGNGNGNKSKTQTTTKTQGVSFPALDAASKEK